MGYPIKKTVTVVWDGAEWRNEETGVLVTGVMPPFPSPYPIDDPEPKHPFDKSFTVTYEQVQKMIADAIEQYKEEMSSAKATSSGVIEEYNSHYPYATEEKVERLIRDAFEQRIINPSRLHYFVDRHELDQKIITYVYHRTLMETIQVFGERLNKLDKPWWKRW